MKYIFIVAFYLNTQSNTKKAF